MDYKITEIFNQFLKEQESAYEKLEAQVDMIANPCTDYARLFDVGTDFKYRNQYNDSTKEILNSFPPLPNFRDIVTTVAKNKAAKKYISDNANCFVALYIAMFKQEHAKGGFNITIDPDDIRALFKPLGYKNNNVREFRESTKLVTEKIFDKALEQVEDKYKTICFLSGNPGAGKSRSMLDADVRKAINVNNCSIIYNAPMASDDWVNYVRKALDLNFKVKYAQIYNDAETSFKNTIKRGIETDRWVEVDYFTKSYTALQDRPLLLANLFGDKIEYIGINNQGNMIDGKTLDIETANDTFNYSINKEFFTNILAYVHEQLKCIGQESQYDYKRRHAEDKLASIEQDLSYACDILSLQSQQFIQDARTPENAVRQDVQTISSGIRDYVNNESKLLEAVDFDNNSYVHENGEFALLERQYQMNPFITFTGESKLESSKDVASIFKSLETVSMENVYAVYTFKSGENSVVQHISSGSNKASLANPSFMLHAAYKLNADKIYFIHNHPSGVLVPSSQDYNIWESLKKGCDKLGIETGEGIIINTKSGKYATFHHNIYDADNTISADLKTPRKYNVYEFSKLTFSKDYVPDTLTKLQSSLDIAKFISSQRLGDRDKIGYIIANNQLQIVGNFFCADNVINNNNVDKLAKEMVYNCVRFGGDNIIVYGRFEKSKSCSLSESIKACSADHIRLLDIIQETDHELGSYISYNDRYLSMDNSIAYNNNHIGELSSKNGRIDITINTELLSKLTPDENDKIKLNVIRDGNNFHVMTDDVKTGFAFSITLDKTETIECNGKLTMDRSFKIKPQDSDTIIGKKEDEEVKKKQKKGFSL